MGRDEGDRRALLGRMAEVGRVSFVRDTKEPRCDDKLPWTGVWWTEDSMMA